MSFRQLTLSLESNFGSSSNFHIPVLYARQFSSLTCQNREAVGDTLVHTLSSSLSHEGVLDCLPTDAGAITSRSRYEDKSQPGCAVLNPFAVACFMSRTCLASYSR